MQIGIHLLARFLSPNRLQPGLYEKWQVSTPICLPACIGLTWRLVSTTGGWGVVPDGRPGWPWRVHAGRAHVGGKQLPGPAAWHGRRAVGFLRRLPGGGAGGGLRRGALSIECLGTAIHTTIQTKKANSGIRTAPCTACAHAHLKLKNSRLP